MSKEVDEALKYVVKGAGFTFIGGIVSRFFGYLFRMFLARGMGPEGYGVISLGIMVFTIAVTLVTLGIPTAVSRYVALYLSKNDRRRLLGVYTVGFKIALFMGLLASIIVFIIAEWISIDLFNTPELTNVLRIICVGIPFTILLILNQSVFIGLKEIKYQVYTRSFVEGSFKAIFAYIFFLIGFTFVTGAFSFISGWIFASVISFFFLRRHFFPFVKGVKSLEDYHLILKFSAPLIISAILMEFVVWTDTFMLGAFTDTYYVGLYNVAMPTAQYLMVFLGSLSVLSLPLLTELYSKNKTYEMSSTYRSITKWSFLLTFPGFLVLTLFSSMIISILFGPAYISDTIVLWGHVIPKTSLVLSLLSLGYLSLTFIGPSTNLFNAVDKTRYNLIVSVIMAALNIFLNYLLIHVYSLDIVGAAIATTTSIVIGVVASFFLLRRLQIHPFSGKSWRIMGSAVLSVMFFYSVLKSLFPITPLWAVITAAPVFLLLYIFLVLILKNVDQKDIAIMKAIEKKIGIDLTPIREIIKRFL